VRTITARVQLQKEVAGRDPQRAWRNDELSWLVSQWVKRLLSSRAVAQAVSRWLPTAAARVRARGWSCGICGGQSGTGVGFLRVLRFPLPIFIPPLAAQSPSSIIWVWYCRPAVAAVPSGLSLTPLRIEDCRGSVLVSCCCKKLVAEAGDSSGTRRKGKVPCWKPLPSNG
jgi:hypothetical protein